MKRLVSLSILGTLIGCASPPPIPSGAARVNVHVIARPKAGLRQQISRVAVYDAAPKTAKASGDYEQVDYSNVEDIVLWLTPFIVPDSVPPPQMIKLNPAAPSKMFQPITTPAPVVFVNVSSQPLSIYSVSEGNEFDGVIERSSRMQMVFRSEGLIEILADPSKPPLALLYAVPSLFVKRARSGETVTFDVPAGAYVVNTWQPRLPSSTANVDVVAGRSVGCTVQVGVDALSEHP